MSDTDDRWLERHGLDRDPFPEADAGTDFFARGGRERLLETLADPAGQGRSLVAIVGDAGVGKTSLFHALLKHLPSDAQVARVTAGVFLSAKNLLAAVARAIGAEVDADASRPELRRAVHARLEALVATGGQGFVVVDDAGELEADALDELVQLAEVAPEGRSVRVVLFALPGIRDALGKASGAQRVAPVLQEILLERYSLNELRGYLQFRLARAGIKGASPFGEEDYAEIFRKSQGIPGRANAVAARMLREKGAGLPRRQLYFAAAGAAAALLLAALALLLTGGEDAPEGAPPQRVENPALPEPLPTPALEAPSPRVLSAAEEDEAGAWIDEDVASGSAPEPAPRTERTAEAGSRDRTTGTTAPVSPAPAEAPAVARAAAADDAPSSLGALAPTHFVLQVLVSSTPARAQAFIDERGDAGAYRFYERLRDGTAQYVVVQGDYASQRDATRAIAAVAGETGLSPFVRSVAEVQEELAGN